jgi:predicted ATPase/class 3 adenylate cyclase
MPETSTDTLAFLFTDIEGSTALWERQPAAMRDALARHDALLREVVESHGGRVFKTMGDAVCAAFRTASDALAAALAAQLALNAQDWGELESLRVRMALHVGSAEARNGDYAGPALNRVARLLAIGHGGQTLVSQTLYDLVQGAAPEGVTLRDLGAHGLRDLLEPVRVYEVLHPALPADFPTLRSLAALPNNLPPQLTSFVGREKEMAEIKRLLGGTRLLTLTGAGGSGKTRLALQAAADLLEEFPDGVWFIELATLAEPGLVSQTVASALGVREQTGRAIADTLAEHLKSRTLLLVLDNCEHLLEGCAKLAALLLRSCPGIKLLATSREPLGVVGEVSWSVPPLSVPDPHQTPSGNPVSTWGQTEAVRLFVDRALLSKPDFALTERNVLSVAQVCHQLDGIPLAIELAAARVKVMAVEQIATRLDDRFRLLTGGSRMLLPRHQTLRATMDWSYELLAEQEKALLRRLSVFAGGWTLEAAEAVCAGDGIETWEVLELQSHLIEKSLAMVEENPAGETRYRLLGTIRQYARDRLVEAGEAARVRTRHLEWCVELAEKAAAELRGPDQALWFGRLEQEHDNLRAALEWSLAQEQSVEAGLRIAGALYRFWYVRCYMTEGRQWLEAALAKGAEAGPGPRARALHAAGYLAWGQADFQRAHTLFEQSLALYREGHGDKRGLARALNSFAMVSRSLADDSRAKELYEEGVAVAREIRAVDLLGSLLNNNAELARNRGRFAEARAGYEEALAAQGEDLNTGRAVILLNLGLVAFAEGDPALARVHFLESLDACEKLGDTLGSVAASEGLAGVHGIQSDAERAARILGAADAFRKAVNSPVQTGDLADYERFVAGARAAMDAEAFEKAWAQGQLMALDQAIALARGEPARSLAPTTAGLQPKTPDRHV